MPQLATFLPEEEGHGREAGDADGSGPVLAPAAGIVGEVRAIREGVCAEARAADPMQGQQLHVKFKQVEITPKDASFHSKMRHLQRQRD
ncbi:MAG: hypothetical protein ACYSUD_16260, partial [Planctomycetota bacterium]